jgi:two-component system response regulator YesN
MSEVYMRKIFKNKYGRSPIEYITSVRLMRARELIGYQFVSLEECAKQSGFSSLQYFSRVFKKEFGITPASYRRSVE